MPLSAQLLLINFLSRFLIYLFNFFFSLNFIGHIQISQVPSRNEPDLDGEINYPFVFYHIAKLGYKGWIGCEYHPRGKTLFLF